MSAGLNPAATLAALAALGLAACATTPAPVASRAAQPPAMTPPPFDFEGAPRIVDDQGPLQCVPFARNASGIQIYGDANTWWGQAAGRYPRSSSPAPGSVFVMRGYNDPSRGHVAVVTGIISERVIRVDQANWLNRGEITLNVPVLDVSPANDWSEVRVWHIPTNAWGARIYRAEGFIHPFALMA
ncbi:MAG: CHAP domain-containing protein [Hyphomonadaceae bacterium]